MLMLWGLFFVLMFLGLPVALAIGMSGFSFFVLSGSIPLGIGVQQIAQRGSGIDKGRAVENGGHDSASQIEASILRIPPGLSSNVSAARIRVAEVAAPTTGLAPASFSCIVSCTENGAGSALQ